MNKIKGLLANDRLVFAPLVFDPLSAKLAEQSGFQALYLGGGALGYIKCVTEANLGLTELLQAGLDIRAVTKGCLILDGACGWGDPMHIRRTIQASEAAGFAAIEIEDQILPKRAHHHIGIEHNIPMGSMVDKIREAVSVRQNPDFVIIARTNAARNEGLDEALRRGEAYRKAGADMLLVLQKDVSQLDRIGRELGPPLVYLAIQENFASIAKRSDALSRSGFRLVIDPGTPLLAAYHAAHSTYDEMAGFLEHRFIEDGGGAAAIQNRIHRTIDLSRLIETEKRTVER
jgi:2-methylisocitrate lyase-like PEP mutase family enzyme